MCQEQVTCDAEDITDHLTNAHALSLEDYHDRFIANDRTVATLKKPNALCRNWDHEAQVHLCLMCSQSVPFSKELLEAHMKTHSIDLRMYEKRFRHQLDVVFDAFNDHEIENDHGEEDDDFGSVFEDEDIEEEVNEEEETAIDPLASGGQVIIQSPDDIDDIDIEENVDYITADAIWW